MFGHEVVALLKSPDTKKRLKGLVDVKKQFTKAAVGLEESKARELFEPITMLMRVVLSDESTDIYLEALKLLKFVVNSLAPHLGSLELHILIGSFVGIIVSNTVSSNMRI